MKNSIITLFVLLFSITINSQTIFGKWENRDEDTGEVNSIVEVYEKDGKAYAKIIEITETIRRDDLCTKCEGENKGKPILGMDILTGLTKTDNKWTNGKILDPKRGQIFDCTISLQEKNKLKIRGYLGVSFLGRTVYWNRKL